MFPKKASGAFMAVANPHIYHIILHPNILIGYGGDGSEEVVGVVVIVVGVIM